MTGQALVRAQSYADEHARADGDPDFQESVIRVDPGDVLVMYTEGLVERDGFDVWDGIVNLEQVILAWPADGALNCKVVAATLAPPPCSDDICLLQVRLNQFADVDTGSRH